MPSDQALMDIIGGLQDNFRGISAQVAAINSILDTHTDVSISPTIFSSFGGRVGTVMAASGTAIIAAETWQSANMAVFVPIEVTKSTVIIKMAARISGVSSGNIDVGIYDPAGIRILSSGSTAMSAINTLQTFSVNTILQPGRYYLAIAVDNVTATLIHSPTGGSVAVAAGILAMASAFPLPLMATYASSFNFLGPATNFHTPFILASSLTVV